jgi:hypothetical protein
MIPVFKQVKMVHTLDCMATVICEMWAYVHQLTYLLAAFSSTYYTSLNITLYTNFLATNHSHQRKILGGVHAFL